MRVIVVKYIPEWVPGAGFQKEARVWKTSVDKMRDVPFDVVKQQMVRSFPSALCFVLTYVLRPRAKHMSVPPLH